MKSTLGLFLSICLLLSSQASWSQSSLSLASSDEECGFNLKQERLFEDHPELRAQLLEYRNRILPQVAKDARSQRMQAAPIIRVPVVVHVIHNAGEAEGTGQNLSADRIQAQIDVLNEDFSATNPEFEDTPSRWESAVGNPEIQFCLAAIDPDGNPTTGITRHVDEVTVDMDGNDNIESEIKPDYHWDPNRYYNIYTLPIPGTDAGGGTTGYAYLPFPGTVGDGSRDGSVVDYRWFGGPGFGQSGYRTLTHETGHYLGLYHPFGDNSCRMGEMDCAEDDGLDDTPNVDRPTSCFGFLNCNSSFPSGPTSCGNEHMYINYMDYSPGACKTSFTNDQISIMRAVLTGGMNQYNWASRASLDNGVLTVCTFNSNDAAVAEILRPGTRECDTALVTPQVTITNFGIDPLSTLTISYQIDNGTPVSFIWIDNLASGASSTVDLPSFLPPPGTFEFKCYAAFPNGMPDENTANDTLSVTSLAIVTQDLPLFEDFDDPAFDPTINGVFTFNPDADTFAWRRNAFVSAYGETGGSVEFDNYTVIPNQDPRGKIDAILTQIYDFSNVEDAELSFDLAYARYDDTFFDSLLVLASTDCGATFDHQLYRDGNTGMATAPQTTGLFIPGSDEWRTETIDLSAFNNTENITFAFINLSGFGNKIYLDNINVTPACLITAEGIVIDASCNGTCDGSIVIDPDNGVEPYEFLWDANAGNATIDTLVGLCAGSYDVTVTDADGCSGVFRATIAEPASFAVSITGVNPTNGNNNDGTATANPMGGVPGCYTFAWSNSMASATIGALAPDTYTVTVTDCNNCTATESVVIEPFDCTDLMVATEVTNLTCNNDESGAILLIPDGNMPYTYAWSEASLSGANPTNLAAGTYSYTVTDGNSCTFSETLTVIEPPALTVSVNTTNVSAVGVDDGTATAMGGGGTPDYTYDWGAFGTGAMISGLAPGVYPVTITDNNGCTAVDEGEVNSVNCSGFQIADVIVDPVTCAGGLDGIAGVILAGGIEPYSYLWDDPANQMTPTADGLRAGTYTILVTDGNGCTLTREIDVEEPIELIFGVAQVDTVSCFGGADGGIVLMPSGGTPDYTYDWDVSGMTTGTLNNLVSGTYCCTVTDNNGCTTSGCVTLPEPNALELSYSGDTSLNCFGDLSGTLTYFAIGGNPSTGYEYEWTPDVGGGMTPTLEDLPAGTYIGTVTDGKGCSATTTIEITQPEELTVNAVATSETVAGANDGTVSAMASGGTPNYAYDWGPAGAAANLSDLTPGAYTVTVTDANGCEVTSTVVVQSASLDCTDFTAVLTGLGTACSDTNDGEATAVVSGGLEPYEYLWSNGDTEATAIGLIGGIVTITITDANDCIFVGEVEIPSPDPIELNYTFIPESAPGAGDGSVTAIASGGVPDYSYEWFNTDTGPLSGATISGLNAGFYEITVTDANGCTFSPVIPFELELGMSNCNDFEAVIETEGVSCAGFEDGSVTAVASGGLEPYTYDWGLLGVGQTINNLPGGMISVTITDANDCMLIEEVNIFEPNPLTVNTLAMNESSPGAADGSIAVAALGGTPPYTYDWSDLVGSNDPSDRNNLMTGVYNLTVTDANGCSVSATETVGTDTNDCNTLEGTVETTPVSCFGDEDGTAMVFANGGTSPYSYLWLNSDTTAMADSLEPGIILVTITDAMGCTFVAEGLVGEPDPLSILTTFMNESTAGASDGSATAMASGGTPPYTYDWLDVPGTDNPANRTDLAPGLYTVVVTDANGCMEEASVTISTGQVDCSGFTSFMSAVALTCNDSGDGVAAIVVSGGTLPYEYRWSSGDTGVSASNLPGGLVEVTVTDAAGCVLTNEIEVPAPDPITIIVTVTNETVAGFNDGTATANAMGGTPPYTYDWGPLGMGPMVENLPPGTYVVEVMDANGCMGFQTATIEEGQICTIIADFDLEAVSCNGLEDGTALAVAQGGVAPYEYMWENGDLGPMATDLPAGVVMITITDSDNCVLITEVTIEEPDTLELTLSSTAETSLGANDGTATAMAMGGTPSYTYDWGAAGMGSTVGSLAPGTYTVTVTDSRGCETTGEVTVEPGEPDCSSLNLLFEETEVLCAGDNNGTATVTVEGGVEPYNYNWSNGGNAATITDGAGTYNVIVTDAVGCEVEGMATILEPSALLLNVVGLDGECGSLATVIASVNGGVEPYTYAWSTGADTESIINLTPGTYSVTISDANGCGQSGSVSVTVEDSGIEVEVATTDVSCFGDTDGAINLSITRGVPPFEIEWSHGAMGTSLNNLAPGTYTVQISDAVGCVLLQSILIESPAELSVAINTMSSDPTLNDGSATALAQGGVPPYAYLWSTGATGPVINDLSTGSYSVIVTDQNGCSTEATFNIYTTGTADVLELAEWSLAPNPSSGLFQLHLQLTEAEAMDLRVYDLLGRVVWAERHEGNQLDRSIDLSNYPAGTYYLRLQTERGQFVQALVLTR